MSDVEVYVREKRAFPWQNVVSILHMYFPERTAAPGSPRNTLISISESAFSVYFAPTRFYSSRPPRSDRGPSFFRFVIELVLTLLLQSWWDILPRRTFIKRKFALAVVESEKFQWKVVQETCDFAHINAARPQAICTQSPGRVDFFFFVSNLWLFLALPFMIKVTTEL